jgi:hypothetical protein
MFKVEKVTDARGRVLIQDPPIARFFFQSTVAAWLWLVVRVYVGYDFLDAGFHKFTDPAWMNGSGEGIMGFWTRAVAIPPAPGQGAHHLRLVPHISADLDRHQQCRLVQLRDRLR